MITEARLNEYREALRKHEALIAVAADQIAICEEGARETEESAKRLTVALTDAETTARNTRRALNSAEDAAKKLRAKADMWRNESAASAAEVAGLKLYIDDMIEVPQ